jgi:8-oxo-dGTP diphosphatase
MAARPLVLVAAAALVRNDGKLLLAQRPAGKPMAGLWEFPGGKVEPGETPEAALVRELREELSIEIDEVDLSAFTFASHSYATFHLLMPVFLCRRWAGEARGVEGQALAWASAQEVGDYPTPAADLPLFGRFIEWSGTGLP